MDVATEQGASLQVTDFHFAVGFDRINGGEMRKVTGQARAFCFFPSFDIPRQGKVPAQLIQITSGLPTVVCQEDIDL